MVGGTSLFVLACSPYAQDHCRALGQAGILVRRFPEHSNWLRFGLPGFAGDWARLETALRG